MGLINRIFGSLFGKNNEGSKSPDFSTDYYMAQIEKEREQRIKVSEASLKEWLIALVKEKGSLAFSWESGNDEGFVYFKDHNEADEKNFQELEGYIVDKLDIPSVGEFEMNGKGRIYTDGNFIRAEYSSVLSTIVDYNEETDEAVYSDEELDSGDKELFAL